MSAPEVPPLPPVLSLPDAMTRLRRIWLNPAGLVAVMEAGTSRALPARMSMGVSLASLQDELEAVRQQFTYVVVHVFHAATGKPVSSFAVDPARKRAAR